MEIEKLIQSTVQATIYVQVISDNVCPWCFVAKRKMQQAMSSFPDVSFIVHWSPFFLEDPQSTTTATITTTTMTMTTTTTTTAANATIDPMLVEMTLPVATSSGGSVGSNGYGVGAITMTTTTTTTTAANETIDPMIVEMTLPAGTSSGGGSVGSNGDVVGAGSGSGIGGGDGGSGSGSASASGSAGGGARGGGGGSGDGGGDGRSAGNIHTMLCQKYGDVRGLQMLAALHKAGESVNIKWNERSYCSTLLSHQLVEFSKRFGKQDETIDAIFSSYFENAQNISRIDVLVRIARDVGLDYEEARKYLQSGDGEEAVRREAQLYRQKHKVTGVPTFMISTPDKKKYRLRFSGAQPVKVFEAAFKQILEARAQVASLEKLRQASYENHNRNSASEDLK